VVEVTGQDTGRLGQGACSVQLGSPGLELMQQREPGVETLWEWAMG
jgi:hypothetical protein